MSYKQIDCILANEVEQVKCLLEQNNLIYETYVDYTIAFMSEGKMVATGSVYQNVIKMIAVDKNHRGSNLTALILNHLINYLNAKNITKYFIFTTLQNEKYFKDFNFFVVMKTNAIVLLENKPFLIQDCLNDLKQKLPKDLKGSIATIVLNCNPVTNGHLHLIQTASSNHDHLILFLVETDASLFPFDTRYQLLKQAILHLKNVYILPSTKYIISQATFPTYFKKEITNLSLEHMKLDALIFKTYFMNTFSIQMRYVGSEPTDHTTASYNETLKDILKEQLTIIERIKIDNQVISASYIRTLMKSKDYNKIKDFVPINTLAYLKSNEGSALFNGSCTTQSKRNEK